MGNNAKGKENIVNFVVIPLAIIVLVFFIVVSSFIYLFKYDPNCSEFIKELLLVIVPALLAYIAGTQKGKD